MVALRPFMVRAGVVGSVEGVVTAIGYSLEKVQNLDLTPISSMVRRAALGYAYG